MLDAYSHASSIPILLNLTTNFAAFNRGQLEIEVSTVRGSVGTTMIKCALRQECGR